MRNDDQVFLKHFSQVIAFLVALAIGLVLLGLYFNGQLQPEPSDAMNASTQQRIRPIGAVYAGSTGAAAAAAAAEASAVVAAPESATADGAAVYQSLCSACHANGVAGAPKLEKAAWDARIAQGADTLNRHAIDGFQGAAGMMPAKGGNPALSDAEVVAAVQWMLDNLK